MFPIRDPKTAAAKHRGDVKKTCLENQPERIKEMKTTIQEKLRQAYVTSLAMGAFLGGPCLSGLSAQAYIISDNFDLTETRTVGKALAGTTTPTGNAIWGSTGAGTLIQFAGTSMNGYLVRNTADYSGSVGVSLPTTASDIVRAQADMHPVGNWLGLQMGGSAMGDNLGGVFVRVRPSGIIQLISNKNSVGDYDPTQEAYNYGYHSGGLNQYIVEYNSVANTLSLWANSHEIIKDVVLTTAQTPGSIGIAGLCVSSNPVATMLFDNFEVTGVVPEPVTLALLALGGLVLGGRSRRD